MTYGEPTGQDGRQKMLSAFILNTLPATPAHVLLLGEQPVAPAAQLQNLGYRVTQCAYGATLQSAQIATPTREPMGQVNLTFSEALTGAFDAALVLDLSPQIHPLALWDQLGKWLAQESVVVLVGHEPTDKPARMPQWLDYLSAIGARCGFVAQDTVEDDPPTEPRSFLRVYRKAPAPRWQLRHVRTGDFDAIATLFQEVFGHPISRELWAWKYANGHGNGVVAARQGSLVAHYGGMYRDILLFGEPEWAFQICDVMVHPKERGVMTRQGPFLLTAAIGAEIYGPLGFGFPHPRAMEVAQKMGLYAPVGRMVEVRWQAASAARRWSTRLRVLARENAGDHTLVDGVWRQMAADLVTEAVGLRDWAYLERRYLDHPHNHYELIAVLSRWTGRPLGVLVLRRLDDGVELLDVVAPLRVLPELIDQARRLATLWGKPTVFCWITANQVHHFMVQDGVQTDVQVAIPTSVWTQDARAHVFKDKWWLMSGDTDFR